MTAASQAPAGPAARASTGPVSRGREGVAADPWWAKASSGLQIRTTPSWPPEASQEPSGAAAKVSTPRV
ncbi:MAG TPA: hypothetical protein VI248_25485 [Kineosporiaceae bacterium]